MSATVHTPAPSHKLAEVANRVRERCVSLEDTLDTWIDVGRDLDQLACAWIAEQGQQTGKVLSLRKRNGTKRPEGLRKRCVSHLVSLVGSTGFDAKKVNRALQLFALERSAGWVGQLKSETKARELKSLAKWHWEGCKLTRDGERSLKAIHDALASAGSLESLTVAEVREIVRGVLGRVPKAKNSARAAAAAFFAAIEGTDTQEPANRSDVLSWLGVLLAESPLAAEIITEAVETHLDKITSLEASREPATAKVA